jgi:phosphoenolpyruvate synthase/pyruvate phosphate dikinase
MWTAHVLRYSELIGGKNGGRQEMAVVVQLQVASVASGVAFTCNPRCLIPFACSIMLYLTLYLTLCLQQWHDE